MDSGASDRRTRFERARAGWLAGYAVSDDQTGGRAHPEPEHPYRTALQRDRERVLHCSAFRRLDFKTQVFVPHVIDHFRTRMTHTLEVAQVARSLARALAVNEDLVEAVALAHDLGHPPFGHGGEEELDALMAGSGGFEHNRQSLRIVDYLEHPYPNFRGLNLSRVVRECLARHETRYDTPVSEEFDNDQRGPIEGQLVDVADEIAYTSADLEDALVARWLTREQIEHLTLWQMAWDYTEQRWPDAREIHKQIRAGKAVLALLADDLIRTTLSNIETMNVTSPDDARNAPRRCVSFSEQMTAAVEQMQMFLLENVYLSPKSLAADEEGKRTIRELFHAYLANVTLLPKRYERRLQEQGAHSVICDFIAGMTDRFCNQMHRQICLEGIRPDYV
ncbi:MAG: deoxyguanosinetriphosphate triphosphohydrolase [Phycisphaerae bacterium]